MSSNSSKICIFVMILITGLKYMVDIRISIIHKYCSFFVSEFKLFVLFCAVAEPIVEKVCPVCLRATVT